MTRLETNQVGEGPEIVKLNAGDPNNTAERRRLRLPRRQLRSGRLPRVPHRRRRDRLELAGRPPVAARRMGRPARRAACPASPRHGSFVSVSQSVLTALNTWSAVAAVASTTTLDGGGPHSDRRGHRGRRRRRRRHRHLHGRRLERDGRRSRTARPRPRCPAGVDEVTAHYDGYADGRVSPSTSAAVEVARARADRDRDDALRRRQGHEVITVKNADAVAATVTIGGAYGSKTVTIAAGKTVSASFSTRSRRCRPIPSSVTDSPPTAAAAPSPSRWQPRTAG